MMKLSIDTINALLDLHDYSTDEAKDILCMLYQISEDEYNEIIKDYKYSSDLNKYVLRVVNDVDEQLLYLSELMQNKSFKYFLDNIDDILKSKQKSNKIKIDLDSTETISKSMRANKEVVEAFEEFCEENSQYRKMDLLSMALKEYMEKYQ